jgi:RNA polymerase sigma factor (sigma-70 family)
MIPASVHTPRRSDPAAFVSQHQRSVQRWLWALGCEPARAEEHCQDALLAALHQGVHERDDAAAMRWLRTTARNLFWMRLRAERRRPPVQALDQVEAAWLAIEGDRDGGELALEALRLCLASAETRDRELLERRYRDGAPRAVMAAEFGLGEAGVKQALRRARERLRHCVETRLGAEETKEQSS